MTSSKADNVADGFAKEYELPTYLSGHQEFRAFMNDEMGSLTTTAKGDRFAGVAAEFLRAQDWTQQFSSIRLNPKKSHENGRDIISDPGIHGATLIGESKFTIPGVQEFDAIISKWQGAEEHEGAGTLFEVPDADRIQTLPQYALVCASELTGIENLYRKSGRSSLPFFQILEEEQRIHTYDLTDIYKWLKAAYQRQHGMTATFELTCQEGWTTIGETRLGAISGQDLAGLFDGLGEALFFENIRGWLGDASEVNSNILETCRQAPSKFLQRNNGITIRARQVTPQNQNTIQIVGGSIVNGCQTTMSVWHAQPTDPTLRVQVKIVAEIDQDDAWKIAESANYQNQVTLLELKLAQYLRPQQVSRHSARLGKGFSSTAQTTLESVVAGITQQEYAYGLTRALFLGMFAVRPNDLFTNNYERIRFGVISHLYNDQHAENLLFDALFKLMDCGVDGIARAKDRLGRHPSIDLLGRMFDATRPHYQAYAILLAVSAMFDVNLAERREGDADEAERIAGFMRLIQDELPSRRPQFHGYLRYVYATIALDVRRDADESERATLQYMMGRIKDRPFTQAYLNVQGQALLSEAASGGGE